MCSVRETDRHHHHHHLTTLYTGQTHTQWIMAAVKKRVVHTGGGGDIGGRSSSLLATLSATHSGWSDQLVCFTHLFEKTKYENITQNSVLPNTHTHKKRKKRDSPTPTDRPPLNARHIRRCHALLRRRKMYCLWPTRCGRRTTPGPRPLVVHATSKSTETWRAAKSSSVAPCVFFNILYFTCDVYKPGFIDPRLLAAAAATSSRNRRRGKNAFSNNVLGREAERKQLLFWRRQ